MLFFYCGIFKLKNNKSQNQGVSYHNFFPLKTVIGRHWELDIYASVKPI